MVLRTIIKNVQVFLNVVFLNVKHSVIFNRLIQLMDHSIQRYRHVTDILGEQSDIFTGLMNDLLRSRIINNQLCALIDSNAMELQKCVENLEEIRKSFSCELDRILEIENGLNTNWDFKKMHQFLCFFITFSNNKMWPF